jgi:predicted DNA binding CopG/RHH family protein
MSKKIIRDYTEGEIGNVRIIKDFLPAPEILAHREKTVKVTIALTESTLNFFKETARIHHTPYQKMIRRLLDEYKVSFSSAHATLPKST